MPKGLHSMTAVHANFAHGGKKGEGAYHLKHSEKQRVGQLQRVNDPRIRRATGMKGHQNLVGERSTRLIAPRWKKEWD